MYPRGRPHRFVRSSRIGFTMLLSQDGAIGLASEAQNPRS